MTRRSLIWFKTDLRLDDNETLVHALAHSDEVLPVYCIDPAHFAVTPFGFRKTGSFRAQFLLEALADLHTGLRARGSGLIVVRGKPDDVLPELARSYGIRQVFAKKEVAYEEKRTQEAVEQALWKVGCTLDCFSTSTLYHALDLPFAIRNIPDVFTTFRKRIEQETPVRAAFDAPAHIPSPTLPAMVLPTLPELGLEPAAPDPRASLRFTGGETAALARLDHYLFGTHALSTYKATRNGLTGDLFSSKFSPWLAIGCLSPRRIYADIKQYEQLHGANESTYWLVFELIWRDYFRFMFKKYRHRFFHPGGIRDNTALPAHDPEKLQQWIAGITGNDFVDANMRELRQTGFMSNRGRQNAASYLCSELPDWRYGAAYFEEQLIDYDVCSNWGNWAYLAGVGNDPRGKRIFNTAKQTKEYDPDGSYRNLWLNSAQR